MAPLPKIIEAMRDLRDFAENHAHDTYEPEEYEQNQESYDEIMNAVEIITEYLKHK